MFRMLRTLLLCATFALAPLFTQAQCVGENLIDALPGPDRDALYATAHAQPFATGNFWQATRGDEHLFLAGTFHLDDPRHDRLMETLLPYLAKAKILLVEAGPKEETELQQKLAKDPGTMMNLAGSGLQALLPAEDWEQLTAALLQRGIPSSMAEKLRPWFVSMMLSLPPCAFQLAAKGGGLDKRLIAAATELQIPIASLEPFDTALGLFDGLGREEQVMMIRNALLIEQQSADYLMTTADTFFAGESRLIWELSRHIANDVPGTTPQQTDADFALTEKMLIADRNRSWIPEIEAALKQGPALAAFGALHLSGKEGVLALLEKQGFTVTQLQN